jgi:hypothetical protein
VGVDFRSPQETAQYITNSFRLLRHSPHRNALPPRLASLTPATGPDADNS